MGDPKAALSQMGINQIIYTMSLSVSQVGRNFQSVPVPPASLPANDVKAHGDPLLKLRKQPKNPAEQSSSQGLQEILKRSVDKISFRGRLEIPGAPFVIPEQNFTAWFNDTNVTFENHPENAWPKIEIELTADFENEVLVKGFLISTSEHSTDAELLYTRVQYTLSKLGHCSLHFANISDTFNFKFDPFSEEEEQGLLYRSKLIRKLKYIEKVFNGVFSLPKEISPDQTAVIDFIFNGITQGESVVLGTDITVTFETSKVDLTKPPFDGPGALSYLYQQEEHELFDRRLRIGPISVMVKHAELASPQAIRQIKQGGEREVRVRFAILDHQIHCKFVNYASRSRRKLQQKLEFFKQALLREEPPELVELLDQPLAIDVNAQRAEQIASGWLYYNRLPDRFSTQDPQLDEQSNQWRVSIYLVYPNGESGKVGELVIDRKIGDVIEHTPLDELHNKGLALASALLHA